MKQWKSVIGIVALCVAFSYIVTVQLRSVHVHNQNYVGTDYMRAAELQTELNNVREKNAQLYQQLLDYKDQIESFRKEASESGTYASILSEQLEKAEILAGSVDVRGPGVIVTLVDSKVRSGINTDEDLFVVHDDDLLRVINELRDAGAEAISLNDERLTATSEIRCAGSTVSVNNNRYSAPFVIKAIGDPNTLEAALLMRQGVAEILGQWGIKVTVQKDSSLTIKGYSGAVRFKYAQPVTKDKG